MKNRRRHHINLQETGGENEIINTVYGDMITFIMVLFILLFVLTQNKSTYELFFSQIRLVQKENEAQSTVTAEGLFLSNIEEFIKKEALEKETEVIVSDQKIKIILTSPILFDTGQADLKPRGINILSGFGSVLKKVKNPIIVEGHTDNVPIYNKQFKSNWELSFHRAFSVVKYLINTQSFSPKRLSALGYGEFQPLVKNDTRAQRAKNRRIEINIIREFGKKSPLKLN